MSAPPHPAQELLESESPATPSGDSLEEAREPLPLLDDRQAAELWSQAIGNLGDMTEGFARKAESVAISGPNRLVISFRSAYTQALQYCQRPDKRLKIEQTLTRLAGRPIRVDFVLLSEPSQPQEAADSPAKGSRRQRELEVLRHPLVRTAMELFNAELLYTLQPPARKDGEAGEE